MNTAEFQRRFNSTTGAQYLKNLYFVYLLEMRAFAKAAPYLSLQSYFTGDSDEDDMVRTWVNKLLKEIVDFPMHFDESLLFKDDRASNLKNEFRTRFHNVTSIIDCAACEKCRLWGKLQTQGLGTALKVFRNHVSLYIIIFCYRFSLHRNTLQTSNLRGMKLCLCLMRLPVYQRQFSIWNCSRTRSQKNH